MTRDAGEAALAFLRALEKLPPVTDIVFHGLPAVPDLRSPRWTRGLTATSRDVRVATENFTSPVIAAIVSRSGRDLLFFSAHPAEREVVLPPEVVLQTVAVDAADDGTPLVIIEQLGEADPKAGLPATLPALIDEAKARIAAAVASPTVEVVSPGKFTEPLYFAE